MAVKLPTLLTLSVHVVLLIAVALCSDSHNQSPVSQESPAASLPLGKCYTFDCGSHGVCQLNITDTPYCICAAGYTGIHCEHTVGGECASKSPCQNGGTCSDVLQGAIATYTCNCTTGWKSDQCQDPDQCYSSPCLNNARCTTLADGKNVQCFCTRGWDGSKCETRTLVCHTKNFCPHGTCVNTLPRSGDKKQRLYYCECHKGWEGYNCHIPVDYCTIDEPCQNNGTCSLRKEGGYQCHCPPGYKGVNCTEEINFCEMKPCFAQSTKECISSATGFVCLCKPGYEGQRCDLDIDECKSNPCKRGQCIDLRNDYLCICPDDYGGNNCEEEFNGCRSMPCQNGATCSNLAGRYECRCATGYAGDQCEQKKDYCERSPCPAGSTCLSENGQFICKCPAGFSGRGCMTDLDDCAVSPCKNNGTCDDKVNGYNCTCQTGFSGKDCEEDINECLQPELCQNNGICTNKEGHHTCTCMEGFAGQHCQTNIDDCRPNPCLNSGRCEDGVNNYTCNCTAGNEGRMCDIVREYCQSSPCLNSGSCLNTPGGFRCVCSAFFEGDTCEKEADLKGACKYNNTKKGNGDWWRIDCNECECDQGGILCTKLWCGWQLCTPNNTLVQTGKACPRCELPACLNSNCPAERLCYATDALIWSKCAEDECHNMSLTINFDRLDAETSIEGLCKELRAKVLIKKEKIVEVPVRIECRWGGDDSNTVVVHIETKGKPGLAVNVKDIIIGVIGSEKNSIVAVGTGHKEPTKAKNSLDIIVPAAVGTLCGVVILVVFIAVMVHKRREKRRTPQDKWVSKIREPSRKHLLMNQEPAQFMNPSYTLAKRLAAEGLDQFGNETKMSDTQLTMAQNRQLIQKASVKTRGGPAEHPPVMKRVVHDEAGYAVPEPLTRAAATVSAAMSTGGDSIYQNNSFSLNIYSISDSIPHNPDVFPPPPPSIQSHWSEEGHYDVPKRAQPGNLRLPADSIDMYGNSDMLDHYPDSGTLRFYDAGSTRHIPPPSPTDDDNTLTTPSLWSARRSSAC